MSSTDPAFIELMNKARSLFQQGQNKKSIEAYREALLVFSDSLDALNEMGLVHIKIGEQVLAIIAFDMAISIDPTDSRAHSNKAEAHITTGSFNDALEAAEVGLKYCPTCADLWVKKARALESELKIDEAIDAYNEALKYKSDDPATWKALALCFDAKERWPEVARSYRIAASLHRKRGENQDAESCEKFADFAEKS